MYQQPPQFQTTVKTYASPTLFQKDSMRMQSQGWTVAHTTSHQPRPGVGRIVALGLFAGVFKPKPQIIVTWQRPLAPGQSPAPIAMTLPERTAYAKQHKLSFKEQVELAKQQRQLK
jgi:hypothetical protein